VAEHLAETVPTIVDCDRMSIWLWNDNERCLRAASTSGMSREGAALLRSRPLRPEDSPTLAAMRAAPRPRLLTSGETSDVFLQGVMDALDLRVLVVAPIVARDEFLGVMTVAVTERPERLVLDASLLERLTGIASIAAPAIQNGRLVDELQHRASHDALTGLANRTGFGARIQSVLERSPEASVGLLFIDLDGFKAINDVHGHDAGDELLRDVAGRLAAVVRPQDTVARLGGDEFAVILTGVADADHIGAVAARVREACARPFPVPGGAVTIGASVGEARWPVDGHDVDELLRHADAAMYREKTLRRT
jgi:diguanylate cyclase (GGDEF)-like protein